MRTPREPVEDPGAPVAKKAIAVVPAAVAACQLRFAPMRLTMETSSSHHHRCLYTTSQIVAMVCKNKSANNQVLIHLTNHSHRSKRKGLNVSTRIELVTQRFTL